MVGTVNAVCKVKPIISEINPIHDYLVNHVEYKQ